MTFTVRRPPAPRSRPARAGTALQRILEIELPFQLPVHGVGDAALSPQLLERAALRGVRFEAQAPFDRVQLAVVFGSHAAGVRREVRAALLVRGVQPPDDLPLGSRAERRLE